MGLSGLFRNQALSTFLFHHPHLGHPTASSQHGGSHLQALCPHSRVERIAEDKDIFPSKTLPFIWKGISFPRTSVCVLSSVFKVTCWGGGGRLYCFSKCLFPPNGSFHLFVFALCLLLISLQCWKLSPKSHDLCLLIPG